MSYKPTVNDPEIFFKDCLKTLEDRDKEERKAAIIAELETCESEERKRELTLELMAIQRKRK